MSRGSGLARPIPTTYSGSRCMPVLGSQSPYVPAFWGTLANPMHREGAGCHSGEPVMGGRCFGWGWGREEGGTRECGPGAGAGARGSICLQFSLESWRVDFQQILVEYLLRASAMMAAAICCVLTVLRSLGQVLYIRFFHSSQWCRVLHSLLLMRKWRHIEIK